MIIAVDGIELDILERTLNRKKPKSVHVGTNKGLEASGRSIVCPILNAARKIDSLKRRIGDRKGTESFLKSYNYSSVSKQEKQSNISTFP
jgi:hypothetical protein